MDGWHGGLQAALSRLSEQDGQSTATLFVRGTLKVLLYRPKGVDHQIPHDRDEVYVIAKGAGLFQLGEGRFGFEPGDVIFVPAGVEHRFSEFSEDLAAWVIFYGPAGGEGG